MAGLNYVFEEYTDQTDDNFLKGRLYGEYDWVFSEKRQFRQTLEALFDVEEVNNFQMKSETAFITSVNVLLSLKTSYVIEYENEPFSADIEKTDRFLSVTLVANF